jgi:predicted transcriptional regulator
MNEFSHFLAVNENSDKFLGSNCINTVNKVLEEYDQPSNEDNQNNSRSGITLNKYRNQIAWRRNKVKELLTRGYAQYEIATVLHISQPTISRDIHYIQKEIRKSAENYGEHLFEIYRNTMLGLDETIKKLWVTIDSPRTDAKERIKAITLIRECYKDRLELIRSEPSLLRQKKSMDSAKFYANIPR